MVGVPASRSVLGRGEVTQPQMAVPAIVFVFDPTWAKLVHMSLRMDRGEGLAEVIG
jgi:hypothetical protein